MKSSVIMFGIAWAGTPHRCARVAMPCLFALGLVSWMAAPLQALAIPLLNIPGVGDFKNPFVPDFYQHQKAGDNAQKDPLVFNDAFRAAPPGGPAPRPNDPPGVPSYETTPNWWEGGFGWCCTTAVVNSLYFLEQAYGITGLFSRPAAEAQYAADHMGVAPTWQQKMIYATEDLARDMGFVATPPLGAFDQGGPGYDPAGGVASIARHVRKLEAAATFPVGGPDKLTYSEFLYDGATLKEFKADRNGDFLPGVDVSATYSSLFEVYHSELCRSEDVTITIMYFDPVAGTPTTAVAPIPWWNLHVMTGAGVADCRDKTKMTIYVADPDGRNPLNAAGDTYLDAADVRARYPYADTTPFPSGLIHYEKLELDAHACITSTLYKNACITGVRAISPVPEPMTAGLLALALAVLGAGRRLSSLPGHT